MAKATVKHTVITLYLDEAEAQYVAGALLNTDPRHLSGDPVYDALSDAMVAAGVEEISDACSY